MSSGVRRKSSMVGDGKQTEREKYDFYPTPHSMTQHLVDNEPITGTIWEPACGDGDISKILVKNGKCVRLNSDYRIPNIIPNSFVQHDFINGGESVRYFDNIITNPPYLFADEFIDKAKTCCNKLILLLKLDYCHGSKRYEKLWMDEKFPLVRIYTFSRRQWLGKCAPEFTSLNGMSSYAWFVWDKNGVFGDVKIKCIDNRKDHTGKKLLTKNEIEI